MKLFEILHAVGLILGFLGAIASCVLMLNVGTDEKKLKHGRIARKICLGTWAGLALLIISGIGLTVHFTGSYGILFGLKHLLVAVITVDAFLIHFRFFPLYFKQIGTPEVNKTYRTMRNIGMLSMTCWVTVIILSMVMTG